MTSLQRLHRTARRCLDWCSSSSSSGRSCSGDGEVSPRRRRRRLLGLVLLLAAGMLLQLSETPGPAQASSYNSTLLPASIQQFSYVRQCVSLVPEPSTTTTTDPSTGELPIPCDRQTDVTTQNTLFMVIVLSGLVAFFLSFLVGLRVWG